VAHTSNPCSLGDWDQEDCSSRPALEQTSQDPISTNNWVQWYTPVIPAMPESEMGKTVVPDELGPKKKN
jgi:hypothetical protein